MDRGSSCHRISDSSKTSETRVGNANRGNLSASGFLPIRHLPTAPSNYRFNISGRKADLPQNGTFLILAASTPLKFGQVTVFFKGSDAQVSKLHPGRCVDTGTLACCIPAGSCNCTGHAQGPRPVGVEQTNIQDTPQLSQVRTLWEMRTDFESELFERCKFSVSKLKNELSKKKYEFSETQLEQFIKANQNRLWIAATESGLTSKMVEAYLEPLSEEQIMQTILDFEKHLGLLINHQYGNFIVRLMIARSENCSKLCTAYCLKNFDELVKNKYSVSVMRRLASHSPEFCKVAFEIFRVNLDQFTDRNSESLLLLSTLIDLCQDRKILIKLASSIESRIREELNHPLLRTVTSIIPKVPIEAIQSLVDALVTNLFSYIDDAIGNYVVQYLYQNCPKKVLPKLFAAFESEPLLVFTNKYRRHVFLSIDNSFLTKNLEKVILAFIEARPQDLHFILRRRESLDLLLLLIFRTQTAERFMNMLHSECRGRMGKRPKHSNLQTAAFFDEFEEKLKVLWSLDSGLSRLAHLQA